MQHSQEERTLALAAIFQAAYFVDRLAQHGMIDNQRFEIMLESILIRDAKQTEEIFGGKKNLRVGLEELLRQLESNNNANILRYALNLMTLAQRLLKNKQILAELTAGLALIHSQREFFPIGHENVRNNFAELYKRTVSQMQPRIMVRGNERFLSSPDTAERIRALLLAGIRSSVLWYQVGGSRWDLVFKRQDYFNEAKAILSDVNQAAV
jgi:high frequency lysogenization protein